MSLAHAFSLAAVVLAAGRSRRAGVFKPAHRVAGRPLLQHAVAGLSPWCRLVVVVAGHRHAEVAALVAGRPGVRVVVNPDPDRGMFSSVQTGAAALGSGPAGVFVLPADCPLVGAAAYRALRDTFLAHGGQRPVIPTHGGRGGHPVLLPAAVLAASLGAPATSTLRDLLRTGDPVRQPVDDPAVRMDLDTPDDLARLTGHGPIEGSA